MQEQIQAAPAQGADRANEGQAAAAKPTWEQLMADPEYNRRMQQVVRSRLRSEHSSAKRLETLAPALDTLRRRYGLAEGDDAALVRSVAEEPKRAMQEYVRSLDRQGRALKAIFPDFDLRQALRDPAFAKLLTPGAGVSVAGAYLSRRGEAALPGAMEAATRAAAERIAASVRSGAMRPVENGGSAPERSSADYRLATPDQRSGLKRRIYEAAARGEKIYPR